MTRAAPPSGIELEFDTFGDPDDPALLDVTGCTAIIGHRESAVVSPTAGSAEVAA